MQGRAEVARQAHNLEVSGSIPFPATNHFKIPPLAQLVQSITFTR